MQRLKAVFSNMDVAAYEGVGTELEGRDFSPLTGIDGFFQFSIFNFLVSPRCFPISLKHRAPKKRIHKENGV